MSLFWKYNLKGVNGGTEMSDKGQVASIFNEFFANAVKRLDITIN